MQSPKAGAPPPEAAGSYRVEIFRKAIHLSSIAIPIYYFYTPRDVALRLSVPVTLVALFLDIARHYYSPLQSFVYGTFGWLLRSHETDREKKRLNGATWVLISATLAIWIFPKLIAITGFLVLIVADMTAALVGRRFGTAECRVPSRRFKDARCKRPLLLALNKWAPRHLA